MQRLEGLQTLRALAALMVLVGHVRAEAVHYFGIDLPGAALPWSRGVDIFFVISGFIITLSAHRHGDSPLRFLRRRLLRVVPLYFLFTTLMVLVLLCLPGVTKDTNLDPAQILHSYLFLPFERADGRIAPVLSLGWTLNYEVFFYTLMALCLALPRSLLAACGMLAALALIGPALPQATFASFYTNSLILEFTFGIALARLWMTGFVRPSLLLAMLGFGIGLAAMVLLHQTPLPRFAAAGLPAMLIVAAGTLFCPDRAMPWQGLGDASYALYLSHRFTLRAATLILLPLLPVNPLAAGLYCATLVAASIWVSLLVHRHVERPLIRAFSQSQNRKEACA